MYVLLKVTAGIEMNLTKQLVQGRTNVVQSQTLNERKAKSSLDCTIPNPNSSKQFLCTRSPMLLGLLLFSYSVHSKK